MKVGLTLSLHDVQVVEIGGESFAEKEWEDDVFTLSSIYSRR